MDQVKEAIVGFDCICALHSKSDAVRTSASCLERSGFGCWGVGMRGLVFGS